MEEIKRVGKGNRSANRGRPPCKLTTQQEQDIYEKYTYQQHTLSELAKTYGIHFSTVSRIVSRVQKQKGQMR